MIGFNEIFSQYFKGNQCEGLLDPSAGGALYMFAFGVGESNNNMGRPSEFETTKIVWGRCQMPNDVFLFCIQSVNYLKKSTYSNTVMLSNCFLIYFIKVN